MLMDVFVRPATSPCFFTCLNKLEGRRSITRPPGCLIAGRDIFDCVAPYYIHIMIIRLQLTKLLLGYSTVQTPSRFGLRVSWQKIYEARAANNGVG